MVPKEIGTKGNIYQRKIFLKVHGTKVAVTKRTWYQRQMLLKVLGTKCNCYQNQLVPKGTDIPDNTICLEYLLPLVAGAFGNSRIWYQVILIKVSFGTNFLK